MSNESVRSRMGGIKGHKCRTATGTCLPLRPATFGPMSRLPAFFLPAIALMTGPSAAAQGCSMCKAVAEESGFDINPGIILLIIVPYALIFLIFRKKIVGFFREFMTAKG